MKFYIFHILLLFISLLNAQSANEFFDNAANEYINSQNQSALKKIEQGLIKFPNNNKLQELKRKIEEQKEHQDSNKENKGNQGKTEQPSEENQTKNNSGEQDGKDKGKKGGGNSEKKPLEGKEYNDKNNSDLQSDRYNSILESLKGQEQNTHRRLMMGKSKVKIGRQDKDW